ncbi:MAG: DUF4445 domain-containing protein [Desulfamplus sp.]|nr:DUF4445 domain-containing protein [Desulfamplus sp.]
MTNIFVEPINIKVELHPKETIKDGLKRVGVDIETPCGGNGICGKCRFWAKEPNKILETPHENITPKDAFNGLRLACMATPISDTTIRLEPNYKYTIDSTHQNHTQNYDNGQILSVGDFSSKFEAIGEKWFDQFGVKNPKGIAVDIGTTTVVVALVCLKEGKLLESALSLNPQVVHGHDVLSRIGYASTSKGLDEIATLIRDRINELIDEVCKKSGSKIEEIVDITIGANTTMLEIAAKIDPSPLGHLPFKVDILGGTNFLAKEWFGFNVNSQVKVYIPPVMHAFVGSDISAGLLCAPDFFDNSKSILYLDMGTNGEICLNVKGRRFTTSTAAGPAFEGMGISIGMRATDGAVERVEVGQAGNLIFHAIGGQQVKGICGSGIVDFIAALLETKELDSLGKFKNKVLGELKVLVGEAGEVYLTQKDIRQIQLAKSAVRTGIDLILKKGQISCSDLDKIYIAGGFGNFLNPISMERIEIVPKGSSDKVMFCGNASIDGSIMLLIDHTKRSFLEEALYDMEHLQLADDPEFMESFVKNLNFNL